MSFNRFFTRCASTAQNCMTSFRNSRFAAISANIILVGTVEILDFICTQKMTHDSVEWDYYTDTPTRIVWLGLLSLVMGWNLETVIRAIRADTQDQSVAAEEKISAKKVLGGCIAYSTALNFTHLSLTTPITAENAGYIVGSSLLKGPLWGTVMSGAGYFLQRLNFSIRPISFRHVKYISTGILASTLQELLDYICTQMIQSDTLDWNELVTPRRLLAWHALTAVIQGTLYGIAAYSVKKYSQAEPKEKVSKIKNIILATTSVFTPLTVFTQLALTTPINSTNAGYIVLDSVVKGTASGAMMGSNMFILISLQLQKANILKPLQSDSLESKIELNSSLIHSENDTTAVIHETDTAPRNVNGYLRI